MEAVHLDASTFQKQLGELAETLAQKVYREGTKLLSAPNFVAVDLFVLVRQAMRTYDLIFYLNADERKGKDIHWKPVYSVVVLPLIRNMIDCLYNITSILENPGVNGRLFRESGFQKTYESLNADQNRFGGRKEWDEWLTKARAELDLAIRTCGLTTASIMGSKKVWPTLGTYVGNKQPGGTMTPNQEFLQRFLLGDWRQYSAMAHGAFEGLLPVAMYYVTDTLPHESRPFVEGDAHARFTSLHISHAALTLLCIVTELQGYFKFDGARINERIHQIWSALMPVFDAKELHKDRYERFMKDRGIRP